MIVLIFKDVISNKIDSIQRKKSTPQTNSQKANQLFVDT